MLQTPPTKTQLSAAGLRFGIVAASYNTTLADALLKHCLDTLVTAGAKLNNVFTIRVPGCFEVSVGAKWLAVSGKYHCVIGLGLLMQGETSHMHHIANAVALGLTQIAIETKVPTIFGIVTADNQKQAHTRCVSKRYNRGREAAQTAITMANLSRNK